jgi:hypothetical protein
MGQQRRFSTAAIVKKETKMTNRYKALSVIAALSAFPAATMAQTASPGCQGITVNMKAAALASPRSGSLVNFTGSGGQLDPVPLLETNINVIGLPGRPVCVTVTFSAQVDPRDNYGVYQASIDNVPMSGHGTLFPEYALTTPIVFDAVNPGSYLPTPTATNNLNFRMVSYTFFASVMPGVRTIRIRVAGCCSAAPVGFSPWDFVRAATMVARW